VGLEHVLDPHRLPAGSEGGWYQNPWVAGATRRRGDPM